MNTLKIQTNPFLKRPTFAKATAGMASVGFIILPFFRLRLFALKQKLFSKTIRLRQGYERTGWNAPNTKSGS
ncbi:MAG: hypothetical protein JW806_04290 [Sedimentisphaerales bacterium]|nr:hypothetical protein [Sedimentisphaerales bacterium]